MSISYPLTIPSYTGFRSVDLRMVNAVAVSRSPFTLSTQAHKYAGQMWQADIALPAMDYINAAKWFAWLGSLNGQYGTFLLGDPRRCTARGTAATATITGSAGSSSVTVTMTGTLLAGDYFQLGSGSTARLYMVLQDKTGSGTLEIWPALRSAASAASATLSTPRGLFRLSSNEVARTADEIGRYGITFGAMEAI
ncbi:MAG: hypothetical protein ACO3GP_02130 [Candidatus Limnocylindrus sp.]